jgi:hypothetical protein
MMRVDQKQLTLEEKAEFSSLFGNVQAQFAAVAKAIQASSTDDLYKQATASAERLIERTEHAIVHLE